MTADKLIEAIRESEERLAALSVSLERPKPTKGARAQVWREVEHKHWLIRRLKSLGEAAP